MIRGKWKVLIILSLYNLPLRFNKLKQVTDCNGNSLSSNLKQLEQNGIVAKIEGPYTRYRLTNDGNKIAELIMQINEILLRLPH